MSGFLSHSLQEFQSFLLKDPRPAVVYFFTDSCPVCKTVSPRFSLYNDKFQNARFVYLNAEASAEIALSYNVMAVPTFIIFKEGKEKKRIVGADLFGLEQAIREALGEKRSRSSSDLTYI